MLGCENTITNGSTKGNARHTTLVGYKNQVSSAVNNKGVYYGVLIGSENSLETTSGNSSNCCLVGNHLTQADGSLVNIFGNYNTTPSLSGSTFIVGCGDSLTRKNAIEINNTSAKILNNLQLVTDATEVNAITPPQDPNNVTQDDQTLVTKSHLPVAILTVSASLSDIDPVLDLSSVWSNVRATDNNIRFYVRINGVCYESTICNCKAVDGLLEFQRNAYDSGTNTTDVYEYKFAWDHTNTTLTYSELFHYTLADNGTISNVTHALTGATITVYGAETF